MNYHQSEKEIYFKIQNADEWTFAFVTALEPYHLIINMIVIDNGDSYIVYMLLQTKYTSVPFFGNKIKQSLESRVDAIYNWFTLQF